MNLFKTVMFLICIHVLYTARGRLMTYTIFSVLYPLKFTDALFVLFTFLLLLRTWTWLLLCKLHLPVVGGLLVLQCWKIFSSQQFFLDGAPFSSCCNRKDFIHTYAQVTKTFIVHSYTTVWAASKGYPKKDICIFIK